jgi:hypothetical protein
MMPLLLRSGAPLPRRIAAAALVLGARSAAAQPAPPLSPVPLEVTVVGEAPSGRTSSLSGAEVTALPGAFGDAFRAVEAMPGVAAAVSGLPYFYVRGAPPGDVGYLLDGIRVPLLFHVGFGPSVVSPDLIGRVELHSGGYPAALGRYAGGVVTGELKAPPSEWHGSVTVRLVDAGATVGGPFDDGRGSVLAAARYSYTGAILSLTSPTLEIGYWDYQIRAGYHVTPRDEIGVFAFGAHDYLGAKGSSPSYDSTFHRVDLRYDRSLGGPEDHLRAAVTLGRDESALGSGNVVESSIAARTEVQKRVHERVLLRAGMDAEIDVFSGQSHPPPPPTADWWLTGFDNLLFAVEPPGLFASRTTFVAGVHADAVLRVAPGFEVTPGIRIDDYQDPMVVLIARDRHGERHVASARGAVAVDPRLSARLAVGDRVHLVQAYGIASQPPSLVIPLPGLQPSLAAGLQRAFQASAGVEVSLPEAMVASVTVFRHLLFNTSDPFAERDSLGAGLAGQLAVANQYPINVDESSVGLELAVHKRLTHHLGALLSYTLSRATVTADEILGHTYHFHPPEAATFDRTHVVNVATLYDFGRGYKAGIRMLFYTGTVNKTVEYLPDGSIHMAPAERLPPFFRLDLRAEKRWRIGRRFHVSAVLEVQDALFAQETVPNLGTCYFFPGQPCGPQRSGSVPLPSAGVEAGF